MNIAIKDKNFETLIEYCMIEKRTRLIGRQISMEYEKSSTGFFRGVKRFFYVYGRFA